MFLQKLVFAGVALGLFSLSASAANNDFIKLKSERFEYSEQYETPWVETQAEIPDLPDNSVLHQVPVDAALSGMDLFVNPNNIVVDPDDLTVRLWVIIKNDRGAYNGSYQAFRCATGEYKVYAYANPKRKKKVRAARNPQWKIVKRVGMGGYRKELMTHYLCSETTPKSQQDILTAINYF